MTPTLHPPRADREPDDGSLSAPDRPFPYGEEIEGPTTRTPVAAVALRALDGPDGDPGSFDCPACGTQTANGAGLFTCPDCPWTGVLK